MSSIQEGGCEQGVGEHQNEGVGLTQQNHQNGVDSKRERVYQGGEQCIQQRNENNLTKELIWRRNAPYFYQLLYTMEMEWPVLSVEWWMQDVRGWKPVEDGKHRKTADEQILCHLALGTHTSGEQTNYLQLGRVYLPRQSWLRATAKERSGKPMDTIKKNEQTMQDKLKIQYEVEHDGQVNKIKHNPRAMHFIATRTPLGEIHVFDKNKFRVGRHRLQPVVVLAGHQTQGYAMEWNPHRDGQLFAGSYDGRLTLWDWEMKPSLTKIYPLCRFEKHQAQIEDISCSPFHQFIFCSCDDSGLVALWDSRHPRNQPIYNLFAHQSCVYANQFSLHNQYVFSTGAADQWIKVWDLRNLNEPLFKMKDNSEIMQLKWSLSGKTLWSVAGSLVSMWDVAKEETKFVHGGHSDSVSQIDIFTQECETIVSTDQSNGLHIFQPNPNAYC